MAIATPPKLILVQKWKLSNSETKILHSYTAEWCGPCKRIKPHIEELQNAGKITLLGTRTIDVTEKRVGLIIPCFDLMDSKEEVIFETLQTSKPEELHAYLDLSALNFNDGEF